LLPAAAIAVVIVTLLQCNLRMLLPLIPKRFDCLCCTECLCALLAYMGVLRNAKTQAGFHVQFKFRKAAADDQAIEFFFKDF